MTPQLTKDQLTTLQLTIPVSSRLDRGWKYLFTSWFIVMAMIAAGFVLERLFPEMELAPKMLIDFFEPAWLNILSTLAVSGLILAIPTAYLVAAIFVSITSMLEGQGGLGLFLTSVFGSYAAFLVGSFAFYILQVFLSGNTH
ncbi:MAG: hypothetical protein L3J67_08790 [Hyphomicrobiaceae bacterium]|nr:hypothetical protein [Hyphomicrobiaceae bacterium]